MSKVRPATSTHSRQRRSREWSVHSKMPGCCLMVAAASAIKEMRSSSVSASHRHLQRLLDCYGWANCLALTPMDFFLWGHITTLMSTPPGAQLWILVVFWICSNILANLTITRANVGSKRYLKDNESRCGGNGAKGAQWNFSLRTNAASNSITRKAYQISTSGAPSSGKPSKLSKHPHNIKGEGGYKKSKYCFRLSSSNIYFALNHLTSSSWLARYTTYTALQSLWQLCTGLTLPAANSSRSL